MSVVIVILLSVGAFFLVSWIADRASDEAYWRAYDRAQQEDLRYFREHPDCTYEEAHQYRNKVMKKYRRY